MNKKKHRGGVVNINAVEIFLGSLCGLVGKGKYLNNNYEAGSTRPYLLVMLGLKGTYNKKILARETFTSAFLPLSKTIPIEGQGIRKKKDGDGEQE